MKLVVLVCVFFFVQAVLGTGVNNYCSSVQYKVGIVALSFFKLVILHFEKNKKNNKLESHCK